ncbi:MAG: transaldolase [Nevskia sp.]|nr:transaldolase [Nevskia sp.]
MSLSADNTIAQARALGQSIWLDDLHRGLISSGRLAEMVGREGLSGVTSNPAIFEKAIVGGDHYDAAIAELVRQGLGDAAAICQRLMVDDVRDAADILRGVYERSAGADGFVSLEVPPALAYDAEATVREARRLARAVDRPNLMIKVPATPPGLQAIEALLGEGICVNATLIFAVEVYRQVAGAYMAGLERLAAAGGDLRRIAGVASFFVSRIDTAVDARLQAIIAAAGSEVAAEALRALPGRAAIANARIAYREYQALIAAPRWLGLAASGARPQRLLWASTGTKNPAYSKTLYVDELIGPDTVNTVPEATYLEFLRHGRPRASLAQDADGAQRLVERLAAAGISMQAVTGQLLVDGVRLFAEAYERLRASVERRRGAAAAAPAGTG